MSATIRHVGTAVGLVIQGAVAAADYGPEMTEADYKLSVFSAVVREVADFMESHDNEDIAKVAGNLTFRLEQSEDVPETA